MKKYFGIFLLSLLALPVLLMAGTAVPKTGNTGLHNYNAYATWDPASPIHALNTDTVFFYKDSASASAFYTTELRAKGSLFSNNVSQIPDSMHVGYVWSGDSSGADTAYVNLQYSWDGIHYLDIGAATKITGAAHSNFQTLGTFTKIFIPGVRLRGYFINAASGLTDSGYVYHFRIWGK